ncbi:hypothetical protein IGI37_001316 [Enterococcus sp. AZ194]|uniref:beta-N-acetylhexosaminidase n=1 Tax=Enterococcus sp. AZ194 TaxID=2774629 RepID=UPI003F23A065
MKNLFFYGDTQPVLDGLNLLQNKLSFTISPIGEQIELIHNEGNLIFKNCGNKRQIYYSEPAHLFRCLTRILNERQPLADYEEAPNFKKVGPMLDLSRNAVCTVDKIKELLLTCSTLGLNQMMLYMEDTYQIPEFPYFGYLRGAYTYAELKEIDTFADYLGIEVVPAIQVLGHLKNPLKWNFTQDIRDTEDILLVNEKKTYQFLEKALIAASSPFKSNRIHIGMDEAHQLGLGKSLEKFGFQNRFNLMNDHLTNVLEITNRLNLEPEMWSDMFFRLGSKTGDYYDQQFEISDEVVSGIPEITMVYWDYYHHQKAEYSRLLANHQTLKKPISFAGGIWTWNGIAPNYGKTIATTNAGLSACKETNVTTIYATLWGDDGAETPIDTCLLGLQLFAEHQFHMFVSQEFLAHQFSLYQGESMESFLLLDSFDQTPGVAKDNPHGSSVSKLILYQDPLLGLYDQTIANYSLKEHYKKLATRLTNCQTTEQSKELFAFYLKLAQLLAKKTDFGRKLRQAYQNNRKDLIPQFQEKVMILMELTDTLRSAHQKIWYAANKPFGWEILDIRYGGLFTRLETTAWRLTQWQQGEPIPELAETILPFDGPYSMPEGIIGRNLYHGIISPSKLSDV